MLPERTLLTVSRTCCHSVQCNEPAESAIPGERSTVVDGQRWSNRQFGRAARVCRSARHQPGTTGRLRDRTRPCPRGKRPMPEAAPKDNDPMDQMTPGSGASSLLPVLDSAASATGTAEAARLSGQTSAAGFMEARWGPVLPRTMPALCFPRARTMAIPPITPRPRCSSLPSAAPEAPPRRKPLDAGNSRISCDWERPFSCPKNPWDASGCPGPTGQRGKNRNLRWPVGLRCRR